MLILFLFGQVMNVAAHEERITRSIVKISGSTNDLPVLFVGDDTEDSNTIDPSAFDLLCAYDVIALNSPHKVFARQSICKKTIYRTAKLFAEYGVYRI